MKLAVIPARRGSKRIPRKNIKPFCGKPMIVWSIEAAQASECFDRIIVSTDDEEIATLCRNHDAEVPFMRPSDLADNHTPTIPVIQHAIDWCAANGEAPEWVCCIYATAPFIQPQDIRTGLQVLQKSGGDYAFAVTSYAAPIQRALRITADGHTAMFQPEHANTRSQDLEPAYHDAAQFYWGRTAAWGAGQHMFCGASTPILLPRHQVQDIDTPEDWNRAEHMFLVQQQAQIKREVH